METRFDPTNPEQAEKMRAFLETELYHRAREIADCGFVPTITLNPVPIIGEYEVVVDVRYGKSFYRDPAWCEHQKKATLT